MQQLSHRMYFHKDQCSALIDNNSEVLYKLFITEVVVRSGINLTALYSKVFLMFHHQYNEATSNSVVVPDQYISLMMLLTYIDLSQIGVSYPVSSFSRYYIDVYNIGQYIRYRNFLAS